MTATPRHCPPGLHQALAPKPAAGLSAPSVAAATNPDAYTLAALHCETQRVRSAPPGQHNAILCRAAYALGQLIGAGLLDAATARAQLTTAAQALITGECGCTAAEVARVIIAGLTAGANNPRRTTPRTSARRAA